MQQAASKPTADPSTQTTSSGRHVFLAEAWWCVGAVCAVLAISLALLWFAQPWADDFARGYKGRVQGIVAATLLEYRTWSGRWAAVGLNYLLTSSFDLVARYRLLLLVSPALLAVSVYALLGAARIGETVPQRIALSASALALYWAGMPHPGASVYWLTGAGDNLAGLAVILLLIAGLIHHRPRNSAGSWSAGAGLCALAALATGFHELFALVLCLLLAGGTLALFLANDPRRWLCALCLLVAIAGFLVVAGAPGNVLRRADFPLAGDLATTLRLAAKQAVSSGVAWVLDLRLLTATALVLALAPKALTAPLTARAAGTREAAIFAATWLGAIVAAFAAGAWAIGMELPSRTQNGIYLFFLLGWFWLLTMLTRQLAGRAQPLLAATLLMRRIATGLFVASILLTGNAWRGIQDLRGAAPTYSEALGARWTMLEAAGARGEHHVSVQPLQVWPQSYIRRFELSEDPEYWVNRSVALYFGLRTVAIRSTGAGRSRGDR